MPRTIKVAPTASAIPDCCPVFGNTLLLADCTEDTGSVVLFCSGMVVGVVVGGVVVDKGTVVLVVEV